MRMRRGLLHIVCVAILIGSVTTSAGRQEFSRYLVILDRRPFGEAPQDAGPTAGDQADQAGPSFADSLQMCAITAVGESLRVGFVDTRSKPPKTYYLFVGESEDGIQVVDADYDAETALLRKSGVERSLAMGGSVQASSVSSRARSRVTSRRSSPRRTSIRASTLTRARYREEQEQGVRGRPMSPMRAVRGTTHLNEMPAEIKELAMRKYNMELIRAGGSKGVPLPIELTPDEDAQLVSEGVLPPSEEAL